MPFADGIVLKVLCVCFKTTTAQTLLKSRLPRIKGLDECCFVVAGFTVEAVGMAEQDRDVEGRAIRKGQHPLQAYNSLAGAPAREIANTVKIIAKKGFDMAPISQRMIQKSLDFGGFGMFDKAPRKPIMYCF